MVSIAVCMSCSFSFGYTVFQNDPQKNKDTNSLLLDFLPLILAYKALQQRKDKMAAIPLTFNISGED